MKRGIFYLMLTVIAGLSFTSCDKDNGGDIIIENPIYGMQINGTATGGEALVLDAKQIVEPGKDFKVKEEREGMLYGIHYLTAGEFSLSEVTADATINYGIENNATVVQTEQTNNDYDLVYDRATFTEGGNATYQVKEDGLYYILTDADSKSLIVLKIEFFGNSATKDEAVMTSGDATSAKFEAKAVALRSGFQVRINHAWKIVLSDLECKIPGFEGDDVRPVISYGGSVSNLDPAGAPIVIDSENALDMTYNWTTGAKGIAGIAISSVEGEPLPELGFEENLLMVGSVNGWNADAPFVMPTKLTEGVNVGYYIGVMNADETTEIKLLVEAGVWATAYGSDGSGKLVQGDGKDNIVIKDQPGFDGAGQYLVIVNADETVLSIELVKITKVAIVGNGANADWPNDGEGTNLGQELAFDADAAMWSGTVNFNAEGNYKVRFNDNWDYNIGGELAKLSWNGADLATPGATTHTVDLNLISTEAFSMELN